MKRFLLLVSLLAFSTLALAAALNLNSATQAQLAALPQMTAAKAKAIVDFRNAKGCFKKVSDLLKVKGITQADIDAINSSVVIGTCPGGAAPKASKAET